MLLRIPAIRSKMGIWVYYVGSLSFEEVCQRVSPINNELHQSELLSGMIQRSITDNYKSIANYLETQEERFFNALILAVYNGNPQWNEIRFEDSNGDDNYNMGIITLSGEEKIFPVDGQHRVAGIKKAMQDNPDLKYERVPVIFVGHSTDAVGMQRTRRMFSTLNRYAKPVSLRDIIALDEDDVVAIASRNLIDSTDLFVSNRILDSKNKAIPDNNRLALTTIITYYECNKELLWLHIKDQCVKGIDGKSIRGRSKINEFIRHRPSDEFIDTITEECYKFWQSIIDTCEEMKKENIEVGKYRDEEGGHIFFRPIALFSFVKAVVRIKEHEAISYTDIIKAIPNSLLWIQSDLWKRIIWDDVSKRMIMGNTKLIELLFVYIYNKNYLDNKETTKIINELKSIWNQLDEERLKSQLDLIIQSAN